MTLTLYSHLECCIQLCDPQHKKDVNVLQSPEEATKMIQELKHLSYKEGLRGGVVQPREEMALRQTFLSLSIFKGGLKERG